jgi:hypothetical protein
MGERLMVLAAAGKDTDEGVSASVRLLCGFEAGR